MSENSQVVKAAGIIGAATLVSRILGFVRDAVIAWFLGAGFCSDAFIAAFRIPNLLRRLFAEGSLSSAFIPVFTDCIVKQGRSEAFHLARSAFKLMSLILIAATVCGILLAPWLARILAPGFQSDKLALTIDLTRLMLPYMLFIGLAALCMGILNVLGHFAAPAFAPVFMNLSVIGSVFFISPMLKIPVIGLAVGVLVGGGFQFAIQLPVLFREKFQLWKTSERIHPGLRRVGTLLPPVILGGAVYQINVLVDTLLGSLLPQGSVTYLYYADRLVQFPLGVFAISAATAVLPSFARQAAVGDFDTLGGTFTQSLKLIFFIAFPAALGLAVLREPIVALLFQRGEFDIVATRLTAQALLYYSVGLWAFSAVRIITAVFFALQNTRTPVIMAAISIIANLLLGIVLMKPMAHGGLALATSLASVLNLALLLAALNARVGIWRWQGVVRCACRAIFCSLIMGIAIQATAAVMIPDINGSLPELLSGVLVTIVVGILVYGAVSYAARSPELRIILTETVKGTDKK